MKKIVLLPLFMMLLTTAVVKAEPENAAAPATSASTVAPSTKTSVVLKGIVTDKETNEALVGVALTIGGQKVYTDFDGRFSLRYNCTSGNCAVKASLISYEDFSGEFNLNANQELKIALEQR